MISPACPECAQYNDQIGLCDGGCRPGCPNVFKSPLFASEEAPPLAPAKRQEQATQQPSLQIQHEGQSASHAVQLGIEESQRFGASQHMSWTRRSGIPT